MPTIQLRKKLRVQPLHPISFPCAFRTRRTAIFRRRADLPQSFVHQRPYIAQPRRDSAPVIARKPVYRGNVFLGVV